MSPNKGTTKKGKSGGGNTPNKYQAGKMTAGSPVAKLGRRRTPSGNSGRASSSSPTCNMVANEENIDEYSEDSDDEDDVLLMKVKKLYADETGVDVMSTSAGQYSTAGKYKVKKPKEFSPGCESFVRAVAPSRSEDPFSSAYKPPQVRQRISQSADVTPSSLRQSARTLGNWRSGNSGSRGSGSPSGANQQPIGGSSGSGTRITGQNAQSVYEASACVFVANLSSNETETELEAAVTKAFRRYGTVFVKIRRDTKNMPYAFCQFTNDADAKHAMEDGRGRLIHGRPVRTELAKANRTYSFHRVNGEPVTVEEGRAVLEHYGAVDNAWYPADDQICGWNLRGAILMQFKYFDDGRKAIQGVRIDGIYRLESTANLFQTSPSSGRGNQMASLRAKEYLKEYERDRNSIFVGSIPEGYTEDKLRALFEHYGAIVKITIHQKPSDRNPGEPFLYGFIEYEDPLAAQHAIKAKDKFPLDGMLLRVSQKNSEYRSSSSRPSGTFATPVAPARRVNQHVAPEPYGYAHAPYQYQYMATPPYYGYPYPSPWGNHYPSPYVHPPYYGFATGSPTPNSSGYYQPYPSPADGNGMHYHQVPPVPYGYVPQIQIVETIPEGQSQVSKLTCTGQVNAPAEEHDFNAQ